MSASPGQPANMVRLADSGVLIWLIIFVMVSLAKGWSKLQESKESQSPEPDDDAPPPAPPTPPLSAATTAPGDCADAPCASCGPARNSASHATVRSRTNTSRSKSQRGRHSSGCRKNGPKTAAHGAGATAIAFSAGSTRRQGRTASAAATSFALGGTRSEADDCGRSATRAILARVTMDRSTPRPAEHPEHHCCLRNHRSAPGRVGLAGLGTPTRSTQFHDQSVGIFSAAYGYLCSAVIIPPRFSFDAGPPAPITSARPV